MKNLFRVCCALMFCATPNIVQLAVADEPTAATGTAEEDQRTLIANLAQLKSTDPVAYAIALKAIENAHLLLGGGITSHITVRHDKQTGDVHVLAHHIKLSGEVVSEQLHIRGDKLTITPLTDASKAAVLIHKDFSSIEPNSASEKIDKGGLEFLKRGVSQEESYSAKEAVKGATKITEQQAQEKLAEKKVADAVKRIKEITKEIGIQDRAGTSSLNRNELEAELKGLYQQLPAKETKILRNEEEAFNRDVVRPAQREAAIKKAAESTLIREIAELTRKLNAEDTAGMSSKDRPKLEQDLASKQDQLAVMQNKSFGSKGDPASVKRQIVETATNARDSSDASRDAMDKIRAKPADYVDAFKAMTLAAAGKPDELNSITDTVQKLLNTATDGGMVKGIRSLASDSGVTLDQSQAAHGFVTQIIHALNDNDGVRARGPLSAAFELDSRLSATVMESAKQVIRDNLSTAASVAEANAVYTAARDAGIENYESVDVSSRKEAVLNAARNGDQVQVKGLVDDASASGRRIVVMAAVVNQMNLDRDAILAPSSSGTPGVKLKALVQANEAFHSATGTTSEVLAFRKDTANKLEGKIDNMISNPKSADLNEAKDVRNMLNAIAAYGEVISNVLPKVQAQVARIQAAATSGDPSKLDSANEDRAALIPILREFISKGTTALADELERIKLNTTPRPAPVPTTLPTTPPVPIVPPSTTPPATALAPKVQVPPAVALPGAVRRNIGKRSELIGKRPSTKRSPWPTTGKGKNDHKTQVEGQKRYKVTGGKKQEAEESR